MRYKVLLAALVIPLSPAGLAQSKAPPAPVYTDEMRNVLYHFTPSILVHIVHLEGELVPSRENGIPVFDDATSFMILVHSAEIAVTADALSSALNQYVFSGPRRPP